LEVASALKTVGFKELYVADLDAITAKQCHFSLFKQIADATRLLLMVDAGVADLETAKKVVESRVSKVVIGTETLRDLEFVAGAVEFFGNEKVVVSLDLMGDKVLSRFELGRLAEPEAFVRELWRLGVTQVIVLDLARVGSEEGVNLPVLKQVLANLQGKVYVGGGVRTIEDLLELKNLGVNGVLLATALYTGKITLDELKRAGFL
jgi:phosphoribosylformimino-5-aminoimidazole carboxamide ribotide isomerase